MIIAVNSLILLLILFVVWWFWLSANQGKFTLAKDVVTIKVKEGVYQPAHIKLKVKQPITLQFIREDPTPCAEIVVFAQLGINKPLALHQPTHIVIRIEKAGIYEFTCQMGMYRGKLIVTD